MQRDTGQGCDNHAILGRGAWPTENDMGFLIRWICAFVLLALTFNPTDWNFVRWAEANYATRTPLVLLFGLVLGLAYIIYLRATLRSIGIFGMIFVVAMIAALIWVLIDWGVMGLDNQSLNIWLGIFALSVVLGVGLSWSIIRRKMTGQVDVDDIEE